MKTTILLTILRPNGQTEIVDASAKISGMSPALFARIKAATKAAGKGDVLRYSVTTTADAAARAEIAAMTASDTLARKIENS